MTEMSLSGAAIPIERTSGTAGQFRPPRNGPCRRSRPSLHQVAQSRGRYLRLPYRDLGGEYPLERHLGALDGILRDLRPDVAILAAAGQGNLDGEPIQGSLAQFIAREADLLRPDKIVLCHHENWNPPLTSPTILNQSAKN